MDVVPFEAEAHAPGLQALINRHVAAVVPGWGVSEAFARRLGSVSGETLCALDAGHVVAALHVRRREQRSAGQVPWFLVSPERVAAGARLLEVARQRLRALGAPQHGAGFDIGLSPLYGVPDAWPHVAEALEEAGFVAQVEESWVEEIWGGWLRADEAPPPLPAGLACERRVGDEETWFSALAQGVEVGHAVCVSDATGGGLLPSLGGWGRLTDLWVEEDWRRRGVGSALVAHAAWWMRLAGCTRVVLAVPVEEEAPEAHRFYPRLGWARWACIHKVWRTDPA